MPFKLVSCLGYGSFLLLSACRQKLEPWNWKDLSSFLFLTERCSWITSAHIPSSSCIFLTNRNSTLQSHREMPLKSAKMEFGLTVGDLAAHFSSHRLPNGGCSIPSITSVGSKQARFHVHVFMYGNMGQSVPRCACRAWQTILHVSPYLPRTKDAPSLFVVCHCAWQTHWPTSLSWSPCVYFTSLCRRTGLLILLYVSSKESNFALPICAVNALLMEPRLQEPRLQKPRLQKPRLQKPRLQASRAFSLPLRLVFFST